MSLIEHLRLGTPLVWSQTDEPERVIDFIGAFAQRDVYRIDPFRGLVRYVNGEWKVVVVETMTMEGLQEGPTYDFGASLRFVYDHGGIFIISNAHLVVEKLLDFFSGIYGQYRTAFQDDDYDKIPMQLIFLSCKADVPPEISRHVANAGFSLPSQEELAGILAHIDQNLGTNEDGKRALEEKTLKTGRLSRAGLGLTEQEFVQGSLLSLRNGGQITAEYIEKFKREKIKAQGILEIRRPQIGLDDIGGLDLAKDLINNVVWAWDNPEEAEKFGIQPLRRILMLGVPGTGKSAICEAIAKTFDFDLAKFGVSSMMSKWIGESEANMRYAFAQVNAMQPIVCWMDELGRDLSGSGSANDSGTTDRVHGEFLTGIQELGPRVFLVGAANRVDGLPPEMLRADRFDKILFVGFPTAEERADIFRIHLGRDIADEFNLNELADATPMFTGAEIKALVKEAKFRVSSSLRRQITTEDLTAMAPLQKNRVWLKHQGQVRSMYEHAMYMCEWASSQQLSEAGAIASGKVAQGTGGGSSTTFQAF